MNREEFNAAKTGGTLLGDADLENVTPEKEQPLYAEDEETDEVIETEEEVTAETEPEEDLPELSEKEKSAFDKRLEREMKKHDEKREKEIEDSYKQKYSKHDELVASLGAKDIDALLETTREQKLIAEARRKATENDWTEDEAQAYVRQRRQEEANAQTLNEVKTLRTQIEISKLKNIPAYAGIESMEKDILAKIDKSNGALTVDEAYWALGGHKRAEQVKLEATMREAERRKQTPRTVMTDSQVSTTTEKPLAADVVEAMKQIGLDPQTARKLMSENVVETLDQFRQRKAK